MLICSRVCVKDFRNTFDDVIIIVKATLVVLFFMHVKYASQITKLVVVSSIVWLGFLFFITLSDYLTRGWMMPPPIPR